MGSIDTLMTAAVVPAQALARGLAVEAQGLAVEAQGLAAVAQGLAAVARGLAAADQAAEAEAARVAASRFINREEVLETLKLYNASPALVAAVSSLFSFPAPNPDWQHTDRNVMGQTEQEFWAAVDGET